MINRLFLLGNGKEKIMKNNANPFKKIAIFSVMVFLARILKIGDALQIYSFWEKKRMLEERKTEGEKIRS